MDNDFWLPTQLIINNRYTTTACETQRKVYIFQKRAQGPVNNTCQQIRSDGCCAVTTRINIFSNQLKSAVNESKTIADKATKNS